MVKYGDKMLKTIEQEIEERIIKIADENDLNLDKQVFHFFLEGYREFRTYQYHACKNWETEQDVYLLKRRQTIKIPKCSEHTNFQFNNNLEESFCYHCMIDSFVRQLGWYEDLMKRDVLNGRIKLYM